MFKKILIGLVILAANTLECVANQGFTLPPSAYPIDAHLVTVDKKHTLQRALDEHGIVRLEAGNYGKGPVTVRSGQQLYGLPGRGSNYTRLGKIIIEPGTENAVVSGIQGNIEFPPSDIKVTRNNTFTRIFGDIIVHAGTLENNLFLDTRGLDVDVRSRGYLRNNRFIRKLDQGWTLANFHADPGRPSTGNVFLWFIAAINAGVTTNITGVPDLRFIGVGAEAWSHRMEGGMPVIKTGEMDRLMLFGVRGGWFPRRHQTERDVINYGVIDSGARELQVYGLKVNYRHLPLDILPHRIKLREGNENSLFVDSQAYSYSKPSTSKLLLRLLEGGDKFGRDSAPFVDEELNEDQAEILRNMLVRPDDEAVPWEEPVYPPVPAASPEWGKDLGTKPDHTQMLQDRLNSEGMVILPPGEYYISEPLGINRNRGIIGAGMDKTVIISKDPGMSMFVYDPEGKTHGVSLANLTLYGGKVGIHMGGKEWDDVHMLTNTFISHVTFMNMKEAGILLDSTAGKLTFDNNYISFCNFIGNAVGIKQKRPEKGIWGFIDKLVVFRSQFIGNGMAVDFPARRPNHLNAFIESLFKDQAKGVARLERNQATLFANCDFINNAGDPVVSSDRSTYFVGSRFVAGKNSKSFLPPYSAVEGTVFKRGTSRDTVVVKSSNNNIFVNSIIDIPVGMLNDGFLANNIFADDEELSQPVVVVNKARATVLVQGKSEPKPMLLISR